MGPEDSSRSIDSSISDACVYICIFVYKCARVRVCDMIEQKASRDNSQRLRGCIGTLSAKTMHKALYDYTLSSAFRDPRFDPIAVSKC